MKKIFQSLATFTTAAVLALFVVSTIHIPWLEGPAHSPVMPAFAQLQYPLGPYGNLGFTSSAQTVTGTVPSFQLVGLVTANSAGAITLTTDTATNICNLFPFVGSQTLGSSNFAWDWYVKQTGAGSVTVAAGAGVTLIGTGTVATVAVRHFKWQLSNCPPFGLSTPTPAANLYSLETTAF